MKPYKDTLLWRGSGLDRLDICLTRLTFNTGALSMVDLAMIITADVWRLQDCGYKEIFPSHPLKLNT